MATRQELEQDLQDLQDSLNVVPPEYIDAIQKEIEETSFEDKVKSLLIEILEVFGPILKFGKGSFCRGHEQSAREQVCNESPPHDELSHA